ncbi:ABC transporter substrate-binding protein [Virgibacillus profundi]|uniref:ABC transporter substrate-binding protein n=1 Tax=Virgibacillus profundi TaxID=2024555 RepID=A0A2A2IIV4_9BACI|nr:extracellular solute-binding protein [Virgibacillus profundi]PAV31194.1 ABC transporter substrate-binding protein [Virgibacillus profundi]PXY55376.1 ABC transporter substrate-binding protein [Virgibacillus profundi]
MKSQKLFILLAIATMLFMAACSDDASSESTASDEESLENLNESDMPIVKEKITLDMFAGVPPGANDWNDIMIWNEYEEITNIEVNFEQIPSESLIEKRNLVLASGDLPDAFYAADIPPIDIMKYGQQGSFLKLNDLIDEYAPNIKKVFETYPEVEKALTFPDGNIYSLPGVYSPDFLSLIVSSRPWINKEWLEEFDMEEPETTEEFYEYLKTVKEQDPNGSEAIPYGGTNLDGLVGWLRGSFGIGNKGRPYIDLNPESGDVRFYPITEEYKEMVQYLNKLYSEKLIEQNIFSIDQSQYLANAAEGKYGSTVFWSPEDLFGEAGQAYVGLSALKGPHGDQMYTKINHPAYQIGKFAITSENEHPEATMRWIDYFYGDEGSKLAFMGIEGETYEVNDDGEYVYMDHIRNSDEGLTLDQEVAKYLTWVGGIPAILKKDYFQGSEKSPSSLEAADKIEPYIIDEVWGSFTYTAEENNKLSALSADIEKYVDEMLDKFISGDVPLSEWENYVQTIKDMGLDEYMEIQNTAFERYESN